MLYPSWAVTPSICFASLHWWFSHSITQTTNPPPFFIHLNNPYHITIPRSWLFFSAKITFWHSYSNETPGIPSPPPLYFYTAMKYLYTSTALRPLTNLLGFFYFNFTCQFFPKPQLPNPTPFSVTLKIIPDDPSGGTVHTSVLSHCPRTACFCALNNLHECAFTPHVFVLK